MDRLGVIAHEAGVHLVIGVIERDGGTLYCTVLFLGPSGELLGKHCKLMPTAAERLVWGSGDGSTMPALETPLWCAPTADARDTWIASMRHIACEGRCFVFPAGQFARRSDYPGDYPIDGYHAPDDVLCRGASMIVSPLGEILAGPEITGEAILHADIDTPAVVVEQPPDP